MAVTLAPPPGDAATIQTALGELARVVAAPDAATGARALSTGHAGLDAALGIGGVPRGRITEVYGPEGAAKTTLALAVVAQAQRSGGIACYVDAEHALDLAWAATCGVDTGALLVHQPDDGEQALEVAKVLVASGALAALVIDSAAAIVPRAELAGEIGQRHAGAQARLLSQALRRLAGPIARAGTVVVVTNQLRERAGVDGAPLYTAGGRALGYYASVRLELRPVRNLAHGGRRIHVEVVKSKVATAGQGVDVDVRADRGLATTTTAAAAAAAGAAATG
jgi:recombination protein RecA